MTESSSSNQLLSNPLYTSSTTSPNDNVTFQSDETGLHGRSDEEKRLIGITTISVVTRLALEFHTVGQEEVTKLMISTLLQRLRTSEPTLEAAIAYNLVDLALVPPEGSFIDVARPFLLINRATTLEDPRFSNNMVLAAQMRLARELMCDPPLVHTILESLTLLRHACENEFTNEYNPVFKFHSECTSITPQLMDDYKVRNDILGQLQRNANTWFELALSWAPIELQSTLQKYLAATQPLIGADAVELGASVAETFAKASGPVHRQLSSLCSLSNWKFDRARALVSQLASKCYFPREVAGLVSTSELSHGGALTYRGSISGRPWKLEMIAEHIGTRTKEDVEEHYNNVYVDSRDWPLPARKRRRMSTMTTPLPPPPKVSPTSAPGVHEIATFLPGMLEFEV
ncbi:hypothetical protein CY34DRAFT_16037 [Suillus luteus UH-Slu-Lm8-n1]|uniref:SANT domain-containing protein n=1 Tax=Suillus luteus UH-Slu-Lm8-n1 TaxID=930992 RepID=A0A0C9ZHQ6_9AGAM|nr:hypothetical protein CY34DRAFT_16037 [Suillus luteus UH-Slu-Lm8-n1]